MQHEFYSPHEDRSGISAIKDISSVDHDLLSQAAEIYDISLGQKYIAPDDLLYYASHPDQFILLGELQQQKLLGVMLAYPLSQAVADEYDHTFEEHNIPLSLSVQSVGLIKSIAVRPEHRHNGIGTRLTRESMTRLRNMSCDHFLAVSWLSNKPDSSPKMFEKLGFDNILTVEHYWTEDSIKEKYLCPADGNPCNCSAIFYFR